MSGEQKYLFILLFLLLKIGLNRKESDMNSMINKWLNPRSLFTTDELREIYGNNLAPEFWKFKPQQVQKHGKSTKKTYIHTPYHNKTVP